MAAYDGAVSSVDANLGAVLAALTELGLYDQTLVVVTADHGESFLEHGDYVGHGFSLHEEEIRIRSSSATREVDRAVVSETWWT